MRRENISTLSDMGLLLFWSEQNFSFKEFFKRKDQIFSSESCFNIGIQVFLAFLNSECSFLGMWSFIVFLLSYAGSYENTEILLCTFKICQDSGDHVAIYIYI